MLVIISRSATITNLQSVMDLFDCHYDSMLEEL